jgi:glycosyltransferase involved in cell wall biosynthesis
MKVAIVCDRLDTWGGAEMHMREIAKLFPKADIYTSVMDKNFVDNYFPNWHVHTTFIQKLPFKRLFKQEYILLQPLGFYLLNLSKYDLVISISSGFAKNLNLSKNTKHIFICLTPPRFLWMEEKRSIIKSGKLTYRILYKLIKKPLHNLLREIDFKSAQRADYILANSKTVAKRVQKFYKRKALHIYPPVDLSRAWLPKKNRSDNYLYLGRIVSYKGVELAIRACVKLEKNLLVAGAGPDLEQMKALVDDLGANKLVKFLGFVTERTKYNLYSKAKALLYPVQDEDFGIVPVEAQSCGCPVIAYKEGGVTESVSTKNPITGVFFNKYTQDSLQDAITRFESIKINQEDCFEIAKQFSTQIFAYKMKDYIDDVLKK